MLLYFFFNSFYFLVLISESVPFHINNKCFPVSSPVLPHQDFPTSSATCKTQVLLPVTDRLYIKGCHNPFSGLTNLLEQLVGLRKTLYLHLPVYCKGHYKMKTYIGQRNGKEHRASMLSPSAPPSRNPHMFCHLKL